MWMLLVQLTICLGMSPGGHVRQCENEHRYGMRSLVESLYMMNKMLALLFAFSHTDYQVNRLQLFIQAVTITKLLFARVYFFALQTHLTTSVI